MKKKRGEYVKGDELGVAEHIQMRATRKAQIKSWTVDWIHPRVMQEECVLYQRLSHSRLETVCALQV